MKNSHCSRRKGNFTVEFAIVGVFFSLLLVFSGDIIIKLSIKGKLERLSYSIVNIVKERTQLFGEDEYSVDDTEAENAYTITVASLKRTMSSFDESKFGFVLDAYTRSDYGTGDKIDSIVSGSGSWVHEGSNISCQSTKPDKDLIFQTSWGRSATFYQVTLCYASPNWFGSIIGGDYSKISVRSAAVGR
ncbi:tight adherence pilus pseudopilin TadF [Vibrio porteresiae]|uniref:Tight adherence pilus pseudopilin TadF n=1 Tax=Vibrio porteresiae DSM 19223 TaxID=1123496 RepID=A0ABZ0QL97_9VIBR|nr:tight adherence pilus pseudopilin TadF [Vibrio porteresiae]WPC76447.1 tight adherence pilus pseudopilin TadF [Vibrio porteresiae DSM 19223]